MTYVLPRRRPPARAAALALAACVAAAAPPAARAQPARPPGGGLDEARERYERGLQLFRDGAYDGAITEFQRAYELAPSFKLFYFIAQTHRQLNDFAAALRAFEQYLQEGGRDVPAKRRGEVEREIAQLRKRVGRLEIATSEPGASVFVDDRAVGISPLDGPVAVNVGQRKVVAVKEGRQSPPAVVSVAGDEATRVDLQIPAPVLLQVPVTVTPEGETRPALAASAPAPRAPERRVPWVGWAVTGALAAGAAVTGVLALTSSSDLKDERDSPDASRSSLDRDQTRTTAFAISTDVLAAGALIAGGVSLYFTLRPPPATTVGAPAAPPRPALRVGAGPGSFVLGGSF